MLCVMSSITESLLHKAEDFVRNHLAGVDASHDWWHVHRVRSNALVLAQLEGLSHPNTQLVELAALLHDVNDWKYSRDETANKVTVQAFLAAEGVDEATVNKVTDIIASVGFKDELNKVQQQTLSAEAAVVQDADRLDAIGAIGIARCFTFGGRFERILFDPAIQPRNQLTKDQYMENAHQSTTINHFYEKLLTLKDRMKTCAGKIMAQQRHEFMLQFLQQFHQEWDGLLSTGRAEVTPAIRDCDGNHP